MKRLFLLLFAGLLALPGFSQTATLYSTTFGTGTSLPSGFSTSSSVITVTTSNPSSGYPSPSTLVASGGSNLLFSNTASGNQQIGINPGISTVGFTNITVTWGATADASGAFPQDLLFEYSTDGGTTWNVQNYNNITNADGTWYEITPTNLPAGASAQSSLQFRLSFTADNTGGTYAIDDFTVTGIGNGTFYSKSAGDLSSLATWGTNTDGTGTAPTSFTTNSQTFSIRNNPTPTLAGNWTVGGTGTKIIVESGINFTIPSGFSLSNPTAPLDVNNGGTLTLSNALLPTFGTLGSSSTVVYNNGQAVKAVTYGNLTISTATASLAGSVQVNGILTLNSQLTLGANTLTLNGTLAGSSNLRGTASSNLTINGTGDLGGTLKFGTFGANNVGTLTINRTSGGLVTLGSNFTINTQLILTNGILSLNDRSLTFASSSISSTAGSFRGSANAQLNFSGTANAGTLVFDQTGGVINRTLSSLVTNRTLTLGSDLVVSNTLNLTGSVGSFSVGANTLTLNGTNISDNNNRFTTTASSSLVFGGSNSGISIPANSTTLKKLTINNASGVILGNNLSVNDTLTLANGSFNIGAYTITLNGAVAATSGTFSTAAGSKVIYNQPADGQNVVAASYDEIDFSNYNKVLPAGTIGVSNIFLPGTATGHTVTGSTFDFNGLAAQTIPAFNYNNLTISGSGRNITFPNSATIGIAGTFTPSSQNFTVGTSTFVFNGSGSQTIPANLTYYNLSTANSGTKTLNADLTVTNGLTVATGTTFSTSGSSFNVTVGGNLTNNGTFQANDGTVTLNGTTGQTLLGNSIDLNNLTSTNATGVSIDANINLRGALTVSAGVFDLDGPANNRTFTLLSTASGDAYLAALGAGASVSGQMVVQRYLSNPVAARKFRYLASPVTNSNVADWQNEIPITGTFSDPSTGVYDGQNLVSNSPSLYYYDETQGTSGKTKDEGYVAYPSSGTAASNPLVNGVGYSIFIRRSSASTPTITLDVKGTPFTGTKNLNFTYTSTPQGSTEDGWNLFGNPFPAPFSWSAISVPAGLDGTVYVKSNVGANGTTAGNFVYYNTSTGGVPAAYDGKIASGQAFFVKATASGTLSIPESAKTTSAIFYRDQSPANKLRIALKGTAVNSESLVCFLDNATDKYDSKLDAYSLESEGIATFSTTDTTKLAINALSNLLCTKEIGISVGVKSKGAYALKFFDFERFTTSGIRLQDNFTQKTTDVKKDTVYNFTVTDDVNSKGAGRFKLIFENAAAKPVVTQNANLLVSNAKTGNQWLSNGQPISGANASSYLATADGNYSVKVLTADGCQLVSDAIILKITATEGTIASGVKLYPNPVAQDLTLEIPDFQSQNLKLTVYSSNGTLVYNQTQQPDNGGRSFTLKTRSLAPGLYILKATDGTKSTTVKFVKE